MLRINKYVEVIDSEKIISIGKYRIGMEIPCGEYYLWGQDILYSYKRKKEEEYHEYAGEVYDIFVKGDVLDLEAGKMTLVDNLHYLSGKTDVIFPDHIYRVGMEIPEGYICLNLTKHIIKSQYLIVGMRMNVHLICMKIMLNREYLNDKSYIFFKMNHIQQKINSLNEKYGYSSVVTNSVLVRIIKNINKCLQQRVDDIYSDISREGRVQTRWGMSIGYLCWSASMYRIHTINIVVIGWESKAMMFIWKNIK